MICIILRCNLICLLISLVLSGSYQDFLNRDLLLTRKLLNQGFLMVKLKWSRRTVYGRHHDLVTEPLRNICVTNDHGYVPS